MINEIWLKNIGVIDSTRLELGPGLNVITGETGAGKSMLLNGVGLVLGARADKEVIRHGADSAWVQAIVTPNRGATQIITELGGELEDGEAHLVRTVATRSRASVCGIPVPNATLIQLAPYLVAVHGQSDQLRLTQSQHQRGALDAYAGPELVEQLAQYQQAREEFQKAEEKLKQFEATQSQRHERKILLQHTATELGNLAPEPGELEQLRNQISRLDNSEAIRGALSTAYNVLDTDQGVQQLLADAVHELDRIAELDTDFAQLRGQLAEAMYQVQDVSGQVGIALHDLDYSADELNTLHERFANLQRALRNYGVGDVPDPAGQLAEILQEAEAELALLENPQQGREGLELEVKQTAAALASAANKLTKVRKTAAKLLSNAVTEELSQLAMGSAQMSVTVEKRAEYASHGQDEVVFQFRASAASPWREIAKAASGGELSRIMLAVEVVLASRRSENEELPAFIFDEVDSGVGGEAAIAVGRRLAELAKHTQVIVVTHLPQVAAFAGHHLVVRKAEDTGDSGAIASGIITVTDDQRVTEIARMLAGDSDSAVAQMHAKELLRSASMTP